jgi:bacillithiol biosynthesis cysteine-adding enzyme BshC
LKQEIARDTSRDRLFPKVSGIAFSEIPGQSDLFRTYLSNARSLKQYYPNAVEYPLDVTEFAPAVLEAYKTDRAVLCDALRELNASLGADGQTLQNIDLLRHSDVVAVVTGQQAGLFGGPLYTIYKALSAIRLAEELTAAGQRAVPIFWMATEDHDLDEVSTTYFSTGSAKVVGAKYVPLKYRENSSVGNVEIDPSISRTIEQLFAELPANEFSRDVQAVLGRSWRDGSSIGRAFGETLAFLTSKYGLILLDPLEPALKRLAAPIYSEAVERSDEIVSALVERDHDLAKNGYHSQVLVDHDYFPLFWHDEKGSRTALRKTATGIYKAKGQKVEHTREDLLTVAQNEPDRLSPGVMLRAVVQDYLLPTLAYFGGGAEIAYFAQNSVVYETLGRPVTPIFHRQSFTILEARDRKTMEKLGLEFSDMFREHENVTVDWATANMDSETAGVFSSAEESINTELNRIDQRLAMIDPTLLDNLAKRRRKMIYHIGAIRKKTLMALARQNGAAERQISSLFAAIMPNGHLQERSINVFSFMNKYGPNFIDWIYKAVDLKDKRHRILDI